MAYTFTYDSHCHLEYINSLTYHNSPALIPGVNLEDTRQLAQLRKKYPIYRIGSGLHPWFIQDFVNKGYVLERVLQILMDLAQENLPDFIGEIGLDKYKPDFNIQLTIFEAQLQVAHTLGLPVIIHCVKAYNEVLTLLKKHKIRQGIIHGFNANSAIAREFYEQGFLLGIGSHITKASLIRKHLQEIPVKYVVLESDAPYMPAFTKTTSSSSDCFLYAQIIAQILGMNLIDVIEQTHKNIVSLW